eukprot:2223921-Pleurochrysis_carterae.AAC.1
MLCDCIVRRMVKIQFLFERARSRAKLICCIHFAQILEEPWIARWRRPRTRTASTIPVRPPIILYRRVVQLRQFCSGFVRWKAYVIVGECKVPNAEAPVYSLSLALTCAFCRASGEVSSGMQLKYEASWRAGVETPPFVADNASAVEFLKAVLDS